MRSHAKASTAGSNSGKNTSLLPARPRALAVVLSLCLAAVALLVPASAPAAVSHNFLEDFGSAAQPTFGEAAAMAIDQSNGDVLVVDLSDHSLKRFKSNGEPRPFSALGSNVIDGLPGGEDATPEGSILTGSVVEAEVAVAPPGSLGGTAGHIYVTNANKGRVEVFDSTGKYVTQITSGFACGVAVDPKGNVFVPSFNDGVYKYVPSAPDTFSKGASPLGPPFVCQVAAGDGFAYSAEYGGPVFKFDSEGANEGEGTNEGETNMVSSDFNTALSLDPATGHVYAATESEIKEWDASGASGATLVSTTPLASFAQGVAIEETSGNLYATRAGHPEVEVYELEITPTLATKPATAVHHKSAVLNGQLDPGTDPGITDCHFEWGTTIAYGNTAPCSQGNSYTEPADVSATIGNLDPGTTIHFRLVISTTSSGDLQGDDQTFTLPPFPAVAPLIATFGATGTSVSSFNNLTTVAFRQGARQLYALDYPAGGGNGFILGFDAAAPPSYPFLTKTFTPTQTGDQPNLAVDSTALGSAGNLYYIPGLPERPTEHLIYGFDSTGAPLGGNFPIDPAVSPGGAAGSPKDLKGAAVDSAGNIWVSNQSTGHILRYSSAGVFQSAIDVSAQGAPSKIAFDSNDDLYAVVELPGTRHIWRYTAASSYATATKVISPPGGIRGLAVDPSTHRVYLAYPDKVQEYDSSGTLLSEFATGIANSDFTGIAVDAANHYTYVSSGEGSNANQTPSKVYVYGLPVAQKVPTVTPGDPTGVTATAATLNAKVDPETFPVTDCHFDWGTTTTYGNSAPCSPNPGSGSGDVDVAAALTGLEPGTTYHFRISAENAEAGATGDDQTLTTLGPRVQGAFADQITNASARLNAKVDPESQSTTYHFEYGPTTAYGKSTPESSSVGFDSTYHAVLNSIEGLTPGTTYHFRVVATNSVATSRGADATFTTYAPPPSYGPCPNDQFRTGFGARLPDCRAYEQATPTDKHGANAQNNVNYIEASSSGDRVTFFTNGGLPTSGGSSGLFPFLASRGGGSWSTDGFQPLTEPGDKVNVSGWSDDLSTALIVAPHLGDRSLYLRDSGTATFELAVEAVGLPESFAPAGFAADPRHLIFESPASLLPSAPAAGAKLYELDHGDLSLVGRVPAGAATSCDDEAGPACTVPADGSVAGPYNWQGVSDCLGGSSCSYYTEAQNAISGDGSKVFFTSLDNKQLYVREDGTTTTRVSVSERSTPDPGGEKPAAFMAATPDGSKVFFTSCEKLTDDSTAVSTAANTCGTEEQGADLYSYDTGSGELSDLTPDSNGNAKGAAVQGVLGTSEDGSYVYFAANGVLAPGATEGKCKIIGSGTGACNLYVYHDGVTTFIAKVGGGVNKDSGEANWSPLFFGQNQISKISRNSADGHTLLFSASERLTDYDNTEATANACNNTDVAGEPCTELYRYSAPEESLDCVSCNPTGVLPTGEARVSTESQIPAGETVNFSFLTRNLSPDGNRVFFESKDALLPTDTNGTTDVYEWEAEGEGSCETQGGCIYLISSGTSSDPSYFGDASASGDDVFIFTTQQLVPGDRDRLADVYDASVGGGLASQHALTPPTCTTSACQANPAPPPDLTPASATFNGPGNARPGPSARRCPKGKRKVRSAGKVRCVKKRGKQGRQNKRHSNRGGSK